MKKHFIALLVISAVGGLYYFYRKVTKKEYAAYIINSKHTTAPLSFMIQQDYGYIKNWYNALMNKEQTFMFRGKKYYSGLNTTGGGGAV